MRVYGFLFFLLLLSQAGFTQRKRILRSCPEVFEIHKDGGIQALRYASNYSLNKTNTAISTLLIYVHGLHRNAMGSFEYGEEAIRFAKAQKTTLLITPQYADEEDKENYRLDNSFLYWKKAAWKDGYPSISENSKTQRVPLSSYEVMDSLISAILVSGRFPNLTRIIIAGHSAGGQFADRYSATSPLPDLFNSYRFRFVVMNPSSYLYPDNLRPTDQGNFVVPDSTDCLEYNRYPKGLNGLNPYASATGAGRILENMLRRDIVFLLGADDVLTDGPDLDVSCAANLQGKYRLVRGEYYIAHLISYPAYENKRNFSIIPGVGHEGDIIAAPEARKWLFDW
jgi:hypothetical protein